MIAIELTSRCNNKCQMCPYRLGGENPDLGDMDFELFKKIVDENPSDEICLFNRGEPFLYPKIYEAIKYVCAKGQKAIVSTNGILIDPIRYERSIDRASLVISLPAGDRETYKKITKTDNFNKVKENIERLQNSGIELYIKMVRQPENEGQEEELKKFCNDVKVVDDSNGKNVHGYTDCSQPDVCPTWDFNGKKKVCCRAGSDYDWDKNYNLAKQRKLPICQNCNIR